MKIQKRILRTLRIADSTVGIGGFGWGRLFQAGEWSFWSRRQGSPWSNHGLAFLMMQYVKKHDWTKSYKN